MNNEHHHYSSNGKRGGISEETLTAAGIELQPTRSQLGLENQLQSLLANDKFLAVMKDIYQDNPNYSTACDRLEAAITKAARAELAATHLEILSFEAKRETEDWLEAMDEDALPMSIRQSLDL